MKRDDMELKLKDLGNRWPVPSVVEAVQNRLKSMPNPRRNPPSRRLFQWTGLGAVSAAVVAFIIVGVSMFSAPTNLYAQVQESIRKSVSAHLQIVSTAPDGTRTVSALWYSRERGVRGESNEESFVDNGQQQWIWQGTTNAPAIVSRRASRDGIAMISDMLQLPTESGSLGRAAEFDREILGQKCAAYKEAISQGSESLLEAKKPKSRVLAWQNEQGQIVLIRGEQFEELTRTWKTSRELSITYGIEIPTEKFMATFPSSTTIVDEDRVWSDRFAIEKALATTESGGLLFAVHELSRCDNGSYYVVSSVRGTSEHLKKHPPRSRRLNLQTTLLDVAEQFCAATTQQNCHIAPIASSEIDGVHYLWWLATDRNYFVLDENKRLPRTVGKKMESKAGQIELPLMANYRGELAGSSMVSAIATVDLRSEVKALSLHEIALRVKQDSSLSREGLLIHNFANATGHYVPADSLTADQMVKCFQAQLDWLSAHDELRDPAMSVGLPPK